MSIEHNEPADEPTPVPRAVIHPDLLAYARQTFDEAEFLAELREVEATGGVRFEDFIGELEAMVRGS